MALPSWAEREAGGRASTSSMSPSASIPSTTLPAVTGESPISRASSAREHAPRPSSVRNARRTFAIRSCEGW